MIKKIDYFGIIKQSIKTTKENKFLWWFGFLMVLGGGFSFHFPSGRGDDKIDEMEYMNFVRQASFYWENYKEWIILGMIFIALLIIAFLVLSLIGRGALIDSVLKILKGGKSDFKNGFREGVKYLGGILAINLFFFLLSVALLFVLGFPVVRLFLAKAYGWGILFGFIAIIIFISFATFAYFIRKYAEIYFISSQMRPSEAITLGYNLAEKNLGNTFLMGLVSFGVGIVFGFGVLFVLMAIIIPFVILGFIFKMVLLSKMAIAVLIVIGVTLLVILILFINSIYNVFFESMWILFFKEIAKEEDPQEIIVITGETEEHALLEEGSAGVNSL